jgi:hypothetical protein
MLLVIQYQLYDSFWHAGNWRVSSRLLEQPACLVSSGDVT